MGKSSLAKAVVHHSHISSQFEQLVFVACDSVTNNIELAGVLAAHLGLKPNKDQTQQVIHHLSGGPTCFLVLDKLETSWEPTESRWKIEEFLSLLSELDHLGLLVNNLGICLVFKTHKHLDHYASGRTANESEVDSAIFTTSGTLEPGSFQTDLCGHCRYDA
jgi:hypothetical protein